MRIRISLLFLLCSVYSIAQVSEGLPGNDLQFSSQTFQQANAQNDVQCTEQSFWSIKSFGAIIRWTISNGTISYADTVFQTCPINSIAFCNNLNTAPIPKTFYGSDGHDIMYFNGNSWDSLTTPPNFSFFGNCGAFQNYLYYTAFDNTSGSPNQIWRYDGTSTTLVTSLGLNRNFAVADLAVDIFGNIWTLVGLNTHADSLVQFSPNGTRLNAFPMNLDCMNAYGSFMLNDVYYIGMGNANPVHPQTIVSLHVSGNNAVIQNVMSFPSMGFADLASCTPGNFIPLAVNETEGKDDILIFPNPFSSSTNLTIQGEFNFPVEISISDYSGKNIFTGKIYNKELNMLSQIPAGFYFIQVDGKAVRKKVLKVE